MLKLEPQIITLPNGLRVVYLRSETLVSHLGVTVLAGSRFENEREIGLAHFLEHCIFKGTKKRKAYHVLSRLDSVGAELNAYTTKEEICIYSAFSNEHLQRATELLADITFSSSFPEKEIEKEKEIILDEINSYLDNPSERIFDDFESYLFPDHSLGYNILGTPESVQSFDRNSLLNYVEKFFFPSNMVVSYVGNLSINKVLKTTEKYFGAQPEKRLDNNLSVLPIYKPFKKVLKESNYQSHILLGGLAPGINEPDRRVMTLITNVLGGPALNSRLTLLIREKYGYAYNVEANYTPYQDVGYWSIYAGTDNRFLKKTLQLIYKELVRFCEVPMSQKQLKQAKTQLKGHLSLGLESNSGLMLSLAKSLIMFNQIDTIQEIHNSIDEITSEDVQRVACKYFHKDEISELIFETKE